MRPWFTPLIIGLAVFAIAGTAAAAGYTARCRLLYSNNANENANLDKMDQMFTALGSTFCSTTTTSSSTTST